MDRYILSDEGRARFRRIKMSGEVTKADMQGYEVLDYLYEHEPATVNEIAGFTRLPRSQVEDELMIFVTRGFIKGYIEKSVE
jgi:DNA-binding MarR family transcriptional regulator